MVTPDRLAIYAAADDAALVVRMPGIDPAVAAFREKRNIQGWGKGLQDWHQALENVLKNAELSHARGQLYVSAARAFLERVVKVGEKELLRRPAEAVSANDVAAAHRKLSIVSRFEYPKFATPNQLMVPQKRAGGVGSVGLRTALQNPNPLGIAVGVAIVGASWVYAECQKSKAMRKLEAVEGELSVFAQEVEEVTRIVAAAEREARRMVRMLLEACEGLREPAKLETDMLHGRLTIGRALLQIEGLAR